MSRYIIAIIAFVLGACSNQDPAISPPEEIPPGTGIDVTIDRTVIDKIINRLESPNSNYLMVASHRGHWQRFPENSIPAIQSCIDLGVEIVEIDVQKTASNDLVLMHDSSLDRMTTGTGKINQTTLSYIRSLYLKDKDGNITTHKVPTLSEAMLAAKGKVLVMIDKGNDFFPEIQKELIETKTIDHAIFIERYNYAEAKNTLGTYLFNTSHYIPRLKETDSNPAETIKTFSDLNAAAAFEFRFTNDHASLLDEIQKAHQRNACAWITTIGPDYCGGRDDNLAQTDPDSSWGWCASKGANILLTDYPGLMVNYFEGRGLR